ncbi:HIT family protein [Herpetosiphon llansteffanensis]|uniref:HIT family protein n=1 Tax=Herpetosiphon llansteffanensis TaxID=2094568 RepID=UPI000D7CB46C|nr:HIT family protein [Herpetosiphon llansteffanensis]
MDDIFSKIVRGELPCHKIAEDEQTLAFLDINPASQGHSLVIPKRFGTDIFDTAPEDVAAVARMVQTVARLLLQTLNPAGINVLQNSRPASGQEVFYYHVHVIPRWEGDGIVKLWRPNLTDHAAFADLAERLRAKHQA